MKDIREHLYEALQEIDEKYSSYTDIIYAARKAVSIIKSAPARKQETFVNSTGNSVDDVMDAAYDILTRIDRIKAPASAMFVTELSNIACDAALKYGGSLGSDAWNAVGNIMSTLVRNNEFVELFNVEFSNKDDAYAAVTFKAMDMNLMRY